MVEKIKNKITSLSKKTKIITSIIIAILLCGSITLAIILPPSVDTVYKKATELRLELPQKEIDKTLHFILNEYNMEKDGYVNGILFKKTREKRAVEVINRVGEDLVKDFENTIKNGVAELEKLVEEEGLPIEDYNKIKIEKIDILNPGHNTQYRDIDITVKNGGSTEINYIKFNIYYKDENGNVLRSESIEDNSCIKPGQQKTITKIMAKKDGWSSVTVEKASAHR